MEFEPSPSIQSRGRRWLPSIIEPRLAIGPRDGRSVGTPTSDIPGSALNDIAEPPKQRLAFVRSSLDDRPAFALRQADDAMDMAGFDPVPRARHALDKCALPAAVRAERKDLFHISARQDGGLETPRMIVRMRVRFWPDEPMQGAAVVEVVLDKGWRHPLGPYDGRTSGSEVECDGGNANGHCPHMTVYLSTEKSL